MYIFAILGLEIDQERFWVINKYMSLRIICLIQMILLTSVIQVETMKSFKIIFTTTKQSGSDDDEGEPLQNEDDMDWRFYIGNDEETIWKSTPMAYCNKTSAKNSIKEHTELNAKNVLHTLDSFLLFITSATITWNVNSYVKFLHNYFS